MRRSAFAEIRFLDVCHLDVQRYWLTAESRYEFHAPIEPISPAACQANPALSCWPANQIWLEKEGWKILTALLIRE